MQLVFILLTASTISLIAIKIYPSGIFSKPQANAQVPISVKVVSDPIKEFFPPLHIVVKSVGISLAIAPATIVDNSWTLYDDKASWLSTSKTPGEGNVILYAHNKAGLFGKLKYVKIADEISLESNGKIYLYQVAEKRKVLPTDVDMVLSDRDQLTLYTCDGVFDQKRLVVVAIPRD